MAPVGAVTTVTTVMATCLVLGVSAGAALAGQPTQTDLARGFLLAPVAGVVMVTVGAALRHFLRQGVTDWGVTGRGGTGSLGAAPAESA